MRQRGVIIGKLGEIYFGRRKGMKGKELGRI